MLIISNIKTLGFRIEDVKLIVNSHAHDDHAGGIARLQRAGLVGPDDPQYKASGPDRFPRVAQVAEVTEVTEVADGAILRVGPLAIRADARPHPRRHHLDLATAAGAGRTLNSLVPAK